MLMGMLMILAPVVVYVLTFPSSHYLGPGPRIAYRILGGLVVFPGGGITLYLASFTGDQGGIAAYFFQMAVILVYVVISLSLVILDRILRAAESRDTDSHSRGKQSENNNER